MMSNPITQTRIHYYTRIGYYIIFIYNEYKMLKMPYIHYIAVTVMNNVSRITLD
jgi:hypothetical protein